MDAPEITRMADLPLHFVVYNTKRNRLLLVTADGQTVGSTIEPEDISVSFSVLSTPMGEPATTVEVRPTLEDMVNYLKLDHEFCKWWLARRVA